MSKKQVQLYKVNFGNRDVFFEEDVLGIAVPLDEIAYRLEDLGCREAVVKDDLSADAHDHGWCVDSERCQWDLWLEPVEHDHVFDYFYSEDIDDYLPKAFRKLDLHPDEVQLILTKLESLGLYRSHGDNEYIADNNTITEAVWAEAVQEAVAEARALREDLYFQRARRALATRKLEEGEPRERAIEIENLQDLVSLKETGLRPTFGDIRLMLEEYGYLTENDGQWVLKSKFYSGAVSQDESWNVDSESPSRKGARVMQEDI